MIKSKVRINYEPWPECMASKSEQIMCEFYHDYDETHDCYFLLENRCTCTDAIVQAHEDTKPKSKLDFIFRYGVKK